jgi:hypothetical protein
LHACADPDGHLLSFLWSHQKSDHPGKASHGPLPNCHSQGFSHGSHPVGALGGKRARFHRKKESSESVPRQTLAGPAKSAAPSGPYILYTSCVLRTSNMYNLKSVWSQFFQGDLICQSDAPSQEIAHLARKVRSSPLFHLFLHKFSWFLIFYYLKLCLSCSPHLHPAVFLWYNPFDLVIWVQM